MIRKFLHWLRDSSSCHIVADAADNSITFSRKLFRKLRKAGLDAAKVYVFWVPELKCYAFALNPELDTETQLAEVMYNSKHKCVGFESLVPTVNRIFYDYGLPSGIHCKLTVKPCRTKTGMLFYQICRPYEKHLG